VTLRVLLDAGVVIHDKFPFRSLIAVPDTSSACPWRHRPSHGNGSESDLGESRTALRAFTRHPERGPSRTGRTDCSDNVTGSLKNQHYEKVV
jgi:hypothetical protein